MTQISRKRWFGAVASLAAAYALVLNVVLSGMLLAALSPTAIAAGLEICHNAPAPAAPSDGKGTATPAAHCPICLGSHAPGAPPDSVAFEALRSAVAEAPAAVINEAPVAGSAPADHRARAPPPVS